MQTAAGTAVSFPDALISHSQRLAGAIQRGTPSIGDLQELLRDIPVHASPLARLIVKQVLMRVLGRFVGALDTRRDAASIQAYIAWSSADVSSEHWRDDLLDLFHVWTAAHAVAPVSSLHVQRALDALDRRYAEPDLALGDVAAAANLSVCQAARLLKRETGRGFVAHLHARRVAASCVQLTETMLSVKEIAHCVGYNSASEFGRHFRRAAGTTPSSYRRTCASRSKVPTARSHHE